MKLFQSTPKVKHENEIALRDGSFFLSLFQGPRLLLLVALNSPLLFRNRVHCCFPLLLECKERYRSRWDSCLELQQQPVGLRVAVDTFRPARQSLVTVSRLLPSRFHWPDWGGIPRKCGAPLHCVVPGVSSYGGKSCRPCSRHLGTSTYLMGRGR